MIFLLTYLKKVELIGNKSMDIKITKTKTIIIFSVCALLITFLGLTLFYRHHEMAEKQKALDEQKAIENAALEAQVKEKAIANASKNGYSTEFVDDKTFRINKDETTYQFRIDASGVCPDRCIFFVEEENVSVKKGNIEITITDLDDGNISVSYDDTRVVINDDGTEELMYSCSYFISNTDFDIDSLVINPHIIDDKQKSINTYNIIMKYLTVDELKEQYNKALAICEQLNEKE